MNYNGKRFHVESSSENSEVGSDLIFQYEQTDAILTCTYQGGNILSGHLIGLVDSSGKIQMRYHQITADGTLQTGVCNSTPEILDNGKIRLHESWRWTSGDRSSGESVLIEV